MIDPQRLRDDFLALVRLDSPSHHESEVAAWLEARLRALGLKPFYDEASRQTGGEVGNLLCRVPGPNEAPTLLLNAHMDVVAPCRGVAPVVKGNVISSSGATVLGADDKAGCTALVHALEHLVCELLPHPPLEVVFTVAEEVGLQGAKALDYSWLSARRGLVAESGIVGHITVAAPSSVTWRACFHGRAAHAGVCPEDGISAIQAAALALSRAPLGRIDEETTCNAGLIEGGEARNVVPPRCEVTGDARSHSELKLQQQTERLQVLAEQGAAELGATVEFEASSTYRRFRLAAEDAPVSAAIRAGAEAGLAPAPVTTGGGSDANIFNERGITTAVLCCGSTAVHTCEESVDINDVVVAARWLARTVELLAAPR